MLLSTAQCWLKLAASTLPSSVGPTWIDRQTESWLWRLFWLESEFCPEMLAVFQCKTVQCDSCEQKLCAAWAISHFHAAWHLLSRKLSEIQGSTSGGWRQWWYADGRLCKGQVGLQYWMVQYPVAKYNCCASWIEIVTHIIPYPDLLRLGLRSPFFPLRNPKLASLLFHCLHFTLVKNYVKLRQWPRAPKC